MPDKKYLTTVNYEAENEKLKQKLECVFAENQELKCSLDTAQSHSNELKIQNDNLLKQVEFYKGQIEAYQYCMNCRR